MPAKLQSIDTYLVGVPADERAALQRLRAVIRATVPQAEECISYGVPAFKQRRVLVGFGANARHCALYLFSGETVAAHADELAGFDTSKGTIRFRANAPPGGRPGGGAARGGRGGRRGGGTTASSGPSSRRAQYSGKGSISGPTLNTSQPSSSCWLPSLTATRGVCPKRAGSEKRLRPAP